MPLIAGSHVGYVTGSQAIATNATWRKVCHEVQIEVKTKRIRETEKETRHVHARTHSGFELGIAPS